MGRLEEIETVMVKDVGEAIGYGRTMQMCEQLWKESLKAKGYSEGGAHSVGPCNASLVDCGCKNHVKCDWCCGSGRITKRVKQAKDKEG